jgi:hypothetical protein
VGRIGLNAVRSSSASGGEGYVHVAQAEVTGRERIYDRYPDVALELLGSRTFDGRIQRSRTFRRSCADALAEAARVF